MRFQNQLAVDVAGETELRPGEGANMKFWLSSVVVALALCNAQMVRADEITLVAPGGMRCALDKLTPGFEAKTGHKIKSHKGGIRVHKSDYFLSRARTWGEKFGFSIPFEGC